MRNRPSFLGLVAIFLMTIAFCVSSLPASAAPAPGASGYKVIKTVPVGGEGGWDYLYVDSGTRRVYISRGTHTVVMDADTYAVVGDIPDTQGVHGIAIASDLGRGFTSNGRSSDVTIFDLKTLKPIGNAKTDKNPDAIVYDPVSKRVFTFNGGGSVFVNIEDTSELVQIDSQKIAETHRWPLAPCKSPSGLSMDTKNRRLYAVCDDKVSVVVNADTGKVVAT